MSALSPSDEFKLAVARSNFLDAFNQADLVVRARLTALKTKPQQLLGPNIETLLKVAAGPQYSKAEKARVDNAATILKELKQIRCDLVHGVMILLPAGGTHCAIFENVQETSPYGRRGLLITHSELDIASQQLRRLIKKIAPPKRVTQADT